MIGVSGGVGAPDEGEERREGVWEAGWEEGEREESSSSSISSGSNALWSEVL